MAKNAKTAQDYFPHEEVRKVQDRLISAVEDALAKKKNLIAHAPTGLGKTAAVISPALKFALEKDLTIFFLTSRHTQHQIVIDTVRKINEKHNTKISATSIIGKKWMCAITGVGSMFSSDFSEFCKSMREDGKCEFYSNTRNKAGQPSVDCAKMLKELKEDSPLATEKVCEMCTEEKLCPYEMSVMLAKESKVIVSDYYYLFNPAIREGFLAKIGKKLSDCIVIVDEGHNLPGRMRELMTARLSSLTIQRAVKEAKKNYFNDVIGDLVELQDILVKLSDSIGYRKEKLVSKEEFISAVKKIKDYETMVADLEFIADEIRKRQKQSYIGSIASFLHEWLGPEEGFARFVSFKETRTEPIIILSYRCLDPSLATSTIVNNVHSTIMMSGTLTPTSMYSDILGFKNCTEAEFESPFPKDNRLALIVPKTTTKYSKRCEEQYMQIAAILADVVNSVPGSSAAFFPSYAVRDAIDRHFSGLCKKTTFLESPRLTKEEKQEMLQKFKSYKERGAVLLGVASGSFGEGIDLPDVLKAVIVVGLPLDKPNLETQELIAYYDRKFGKGWDYGYVLPAVTKCLQNAGRCIRSETDRGVIIFLDERYSWPSYIKCFPPDWDLDITVDYKEKISRFFSKTK
jgi:DNA excision repair protein ERCC-2